MSITHFLTLRHCLAAALLLMGVARVALGHPAPFSYVDLHLEGDGIHGAIVIHDFDAAHELKLEKPESLLSDAEARRHRATLIASIQSRLRFGSNNGELTPEWGDIEVLAARQSLRLPFRLDGTVADTLDVEAHLFPYDPQHQTFINIYERGALQQQSILDTKTRTLRFYTGSPQGRWAVVRTFFNAGIHHILIGPDHVLFLLGLILLGGSWWRLATIVTAFTLGHSVTLSLATLGVLQLSPALVEPAIALSIIVVGVDNLLVLQQRRSPDASRVTTRDLRAGMAAVFGLVHGFGFASVLIEFGLPPNALGWSLAAFNVGVEVGQILIVLALLGLARLIIAVPIYRPTLSERFLTLASAAVIVAGVYWLAERIGLLR